MDFVCNIAVLAKKELDLCLNTLPYQKESNLPMRSQ
jgi:hypothetical protein